MSEAAIARLRQLITEERQRVGAEMVRLISHFNLEKFQKKAVEAVAHGPEASGSRDPRRVAAALGRAARRAEGLRAAIDNAASIYLPDRLHKVRIAVKKLRYATPSNRATADLSGARDRRPRGVATLKRAQDLLGRMHDLEMLIARTRAVQGSPKRRISASGDLDVLRAPAGNECRRLHGRVT